MPIVVDLPAPLGPSRPKTSPAATSKSIAFTASVPFGYVLVRRLTEIMRFSFHSGHIGRVSFVRRMTATSEEM